ncbi:MAG: hypothetical protein NUV94_08270 [Candidatus Acetothermia bacterium]|nr:hypothetical protein [Candidatus Acetothermia bacterium]
MSEREVQDLLGEIEEFRAWLLAEIKRRFLSTTRGERDEDVWVLWLAAFWGAARESGGLPSDLCPVM